MGRREPAEGSSSPNANLRLLSIASSGTIGERLKLTLSDGSSFSLPIDAMLNPQLPVSSLQIGAELDADTVEALQEQAQAFAVRQKALRLLAAAPHTKAGLKRKLLAKGGKLEQVDEELERLAGRGLLDDRAFALSWIRQRLERHPEGEGLLIAGLTRRGVSRELAKEVVRASFTPEAERESARRLIEKLKRRSGMSPQRLEGTLFSRGFRRSVIRELLEES